MSAFEGKADIGRTRQCLLMAQSGLFEAVIVDTGEHRPSCIVDAKLRFGREIGRDSNLKFG